MTDVTPPPTIDTVSVSQSKIDESPIPSASIPPANDGILNDKAISTDIFDTPPPSVKTDKQIPTLLSNNPSSIKFEDNPSAYLKAKIESLVYWENPKKSALFLVGSLSILILSEFYSSLQIIAGVFTFVTGMNWVFVNTHKQGQKFIGGKSSKDISNPHSERLNRKENYIPRDRVLRAAHITIDIAEVITQQITKLVLIEDNWRSTISLVISYLVWTLAKYVSTKYLLAFFILSTFSLPRFYLQHQAKIDAHIAQQSNNARVLAEKYGKLANSKAKELTTQAKSYLKKKPVSTQNTVKED
ncbi:MAG: Reticulon-domain-containing protein [Benjaminiella poitrasii]|nr:MAG: Reticulon-domain-containing protein [Benjaminiella poitrasii]